MLSPAAPVLGHSPEAFGNLLIAPWWPNLQSASGVVTNQSPRDQIANIRWIIEKHLFLLY